MAIVARLARDFLGRRTARLAALGMATSPFQVYYAQEARMYGLAIALSAGVLWASLQVATRDDRTGWWLYVTLAAAGLYVHYYVGLMIAVLHLWLILYGPRTRKQLPSLLAADAVVALAFLPQLMQFRAEAGEFLGEPRWRVAPSPLEPLRSLYYLLFGHVLPLKLVFAGLFLVLALLAVGLASHRGQLRDIEWLLLTVVLVPVFLVLGMSLLITPVYVERSFAVLTPALILLLARYTGGRPRRSPAPYLGIGLVSLMILGVVLYHVRADPAKPPLREAISTVAKEARSTDKILHLQDASYVPALYYEPVRAGELLNAGQRLWLAPDIYRLLGGRTVQPVDLTWSARTWVISMPGYLDAVQSEPLERLGVDEDPVQTWSWDIVGPGGRKYESIGVRLYTPSSR